MQLWIECPDCKGAAGCWVRADHYNASPLSPLDENGGWSWVPCEPCDGKGRVPLARPDGPVDEIEEECTRG